MIIYNDIPLYAKKCAAWPLYIHYTCVVLDIGIWKIYTYTYTILIPWSILCMLPPQHLFVMVISKGYHLFVHHLYIFGENDNDTNYISYLPWERKGAVWSETLKFGSEKPLIPYDTLYSAPPGKSHIFHIAVPSLITCHLGGEGCFLVLGRFKQQSIFFWFLYIDRYFEWAPCWYVESISSIVQCVVWVDGLPS